MACYVGAVVVDPKSASEPASAGPPETAPVDMAPASPVAVETGAASRPVQVTEAEPVADRSGNGAEPISVRVGERASPPPSGALGGRASTPPAAPRTSTAGPRSTRPVVGPPPGPRPSPPQLSPRMTAVFGGLFGLATVTSIVALLIQVVPPRNERAVAAAAAPSTSASAAVPLAALIEARRPKRTPIPGPWRVTELEKDPAVIVASSTTDRKSFIDALADKGVPKSQAYRIMKAFDGLRKFDKTGRKDRFTVAMERSGRRVRAFEYQVTPTEIYQAREDKDGLLVGVRLDMKVAEAEVVSAFYVGSDVVLSYQAAGIEDGILGTLDDALTGRMSTESFEEGAIVRFIGVEQTALGLFAGYKRITALEYRPRDPAAKALRIYNFDGQESHGYFDERGRQPYAGGWRSPIPGAPVTSRFNPKRMHPVLHKIMPHQGTDFGAPMGAPVYSAYRGVVESVGPAGPSGNLVTIAHANGISTGYAHLSKFAPGIKVGDKVGTHQLVGYVGSTGRSTGPHLHFSAKKDGKFFDAETLQLDGERVMPTVDRAAFLAAKAELDKRLDAIPLPEPPPEHPKPVAAASASGAPVAEPGAEVDGGLHPSAMVEDDSDDDEEGAEVLGAPALGTAAPTASAQAKPTKDPAQEDGE